MPLDPQFLHASLQRRGLEAQQRGGPVLASDAPAGELQNRDDVVPLELFQRRNTGLAGRPADLGDEATGLQLGAGAEDDAPSS